MTEPAHFSRHKADRRLAIVVTLVAFAAQWYRHATFRSTTYDLAVFEQVVWKMGHGLGATSSLTAWNTFGDHLSPILLAFVPLYKIAATPLWFFGAQAIAAGLGVLCVRPLAVAAGGKPDAKLTSLLVVAFAINPAVWNAVLFDFHPTTLALPILLIGCTAALRHRQRDLWVAMLMLVVLRDDLALSGAMLGAIGWTRDTPAGRRSRSALVGVGLAWTVIGAQIGTALGASRHFASRYGYIGTSITDAVVHPIHAGLGVASHLFAANNVMPILALLVPLAFLPLGRPRWALLGLVVSLPFLLARDPNLHSTDTQYGASVVPFLFLAAAGTASTLTGAWYRRALFYGVPLGVAAFAVIGPPATNALTVSAPNPADARAALRTIRPSDVVVATGYIAPHVADRADLIPFPWPFFDATHTFPLDPRVTSTSRAKQATVDVVVMAKSDLEGSAVIDHFLETPNLRRDFREEQYGDVVLFRRHTTH